MKITFFSNFLNHHQLPFCLEMHSLLGDDFRFVATEPIHQERLEMGFADMSELYPFSLNTYSSEQNHAEGLKLGVESDVVIIGSAPSIFIEGRMLENKLTFHYNERIFRKGRWRVLSPRTLYFLYKHHIRHKNKSLYMLCASAYTAGDFKLVGTYINKTYKWGYFPEVKDFGLNDLFSKKKNVLPKLLWVGRLINLKHPEHTLILADKLKKEGYDFTLDIIGTGVMKDSLCELINKYKLEDRVKLLGNIKPENVREHMESANIFLFTSDFNEGWGAVLNEAMNSGCAVVANNAIGAVPFLVKNGQNGLIYKNGNLNDFIGCVKKILDDNLYCEQLGKEAYKTLAETWNPKVAAERIITLSNHLLKGERFYFEEGPCSKA